MILTAFIIKSELKLNLTKNLDNLKNKQLQLFKFIK